MPKTYVKLTPEQKAANKILKREAKRQELAPDPEPKNGRPKAELEIDKIRGMAKLGCTDKQIAAVMGVHVTTLKRRMKEEPELADAIEQGRELGVVELRQLLKRHSEGEGGPAVNATIHRTKIEMGFSDRPSDSKHTVDVNIAINSGGDKISRLLEDIRARMLAAQPLPQLEVLGDVETVESVTECVDGGMAGEQADGGTDGVSGESISGGEGGS